MYLIVEKILGNARSAAAWPVQGTTGYDFLNAVNGLFATTKKAGPMERLTGAFTGLAGSAGCCCGRKRLVLTPSFAGSLRAVASTEQNRRRHDPGRDSRLPLSQALARS